MESVNENTMPRNTMPIAQLLEQIRNTMPIAHGLLHEISEIPRFANVLYFDGWAVQYFNGEIKHSWEDFLKRLNEVSFLSCSKNVDDTFIKYVFNRVNGITVTITIPKVWRLPVPVRINATRPKIMGDHLLKF